MQVLRGDALVFAEARAPGNLNRFANIKSVSKSVVSLLMGTAFDRGELTSINATIGEVAPKLLPLQVWTPLLVRSMYGFGDSGPVVNRK